jgi:hypothetical protein
MPHQTMIGWAGTKAAGKMSTTPLPRQEEKNEVKRPNIQHLENAASSCSWS